MLALIELHRAPNGLYKNEVIHLRTKMGGLQDLFFVYSKYQCTSLGLVFFVIVFIVVDELWQASTYCPPVQTNRWSGQYLGVPKISFLAVVIEGQF